MDIERERDRSPDSDDGREKKSKKSKSDKKHKKVSKFTSPVVVDIIGVIRHSWLWVGLNCRIRKARRKRSPRRRNTKSLPSPAKSVKRQVVHLPIHRLVIVIAMTATFEEASLPARR